MGGAPLIIPLVALVIPIALLIFAVLFDVAVLLWAGYRTWQDRVRPQLLLAQQRTFATVRLVGRRYSLRLAHHR
jgi:hypothetical protein